MAGFKKSPRTGLTELKHKREIEQCSDMHANVGICLDHAATKGIQKQNRVDIEFILFSLSVSMLSTVCPLGGRIIMI